MKRTTLISLIAAAALAVAAAPASGAVTIGSDLTGTANSNNCGANVCTTSNLALGNNLAPGGLRSPVNGTVTSWRFKSGSGGNTVSLRVLEPGANVSFTGGGASASVESDIGPNGPFATSVPIGIGDAIGLDRSNGAIVLSNNPAASQVYWTMPTLANGSTRDGTLGGAYELLVQAVVEPSNTLTFGTPVLNRKKGAATITVDVPNAGQLAVGGTNVTVVGAPGTVAAAGQITVAVQATGQALRKLKSKGKTTVTPSFTFTPDSGAAKGQTTRVTLVKKLKKRKK